MDYEKKYTEALEKGREFYEKLGNKQLKEEIEQIFPELKETKDEKIRKALISAVKANIFRYESVDKKDMLSWLEKQGGQKPAWSEEDEKQLNDTIELLPGLSNRHNWLKSLKDRVLPQPNQEWSEEDSKNMKECVIAVSMSEGHTLEEKEQLEKWLKEKTHLYNIQNVPVDENKLKEDRRQAE